MRPRPRATTYGRMTRGRMTRDRIRMTRSRLTRAHLTHHSLTHGPLHPSLPFLPLITLTAAWLATRAVMLWLFTHDDFALLGGGAVSGEVGHLYRRWYGILSHGSFPRGDALWQYPPGAGPALLLPGLLPRLTYVQGFTLLALTADAAITIALAVSGLRSGLGGGLRGATLWTFSLPLLLNLPYSRYDLLVTAPAVLSLLLLRSHPRTGGALAALGALVKVWPGLILLSVPFGRARTAWMSAAVTTATTLALITAFFDGAFDFLRHEGSRGVQIESMGGTVLSLAMHAGWPGRVEYRYGAMEFVGPYVDAVAWTCHALTAAAFAILLLWRLRTPSHRWPDATPYDATLAAVLLFTVTSRVISPQYMVWLLGLSAVCLTARHTTQRPVTTMLVAAAAVSSVAYPALYAQVMDCTWTGCAVMLVRNTLLGAATVLSVTRLWRSTRPTTPEGHDDPRRESVPVGG